MIRLSLIKRNLSERSQFTCLGLGVLFLFLCACTPTLPPVSSAGTLGPVLTAPLPPDARILVISNLTDAPITIIRENIFQYHLLGKTSVSGELMNSAINRAILQLFHKNGYREVQTLTIINPHYWNSRKQLIDSINAQRHADIIILITKNNEKHILGFDIHCEVSRFNQYYQAIIEPHLDLYKITVIAAQNQQVLTWITGSINGNLRNTRFCKPLSSFSMRDYLALNSIVNTGLHVAITRDISKILLLANDT
jgi:hypothetical protein